MGDRLVVGICGYKGAGKDTLGQAIVQHLDEPVIQFNFADPLKQVCGIVFGEPERWHNPGLKEVQFPTWPHATPRYIMQKIGTEMFRKHFPGVWIKAWERRVSECGAHVVCTDYRFLDEADALRRVGAKLIRVDRLGYGPDGHESESFVERLSHDIVVYNTAGGAEDFARRAVDQLVAAGVLPPAYDDDLYPGALVTHAADGSVGEVVSIGPEGTVDVDWFNLSPSRALEFRSDLRPYVGRGPR